MLYHRADVELDVLYGVLLESQTVRETIDLREFVTRVKDPLFELGKLIKEGIRIIELR
jgi:hypothetical protein